MYDIQFAISIIICAIGIGVFLATTILLIWNLVDGYGFMSIRDKGYIIAGIIGLVILPYLYSLLSNITNYLILQRLCMKDY